MSTKISDALSASNVVEYHHTELAANYSQNYFSESGKARGVWFGQQCAGLGLQAGAAVDELHFTRVANGQHPMTEEQLIRWKTASEKQPVWLESDDAWKTHIEGMLADAIEGGRNVFDAVRPQGNEPAVRGRAVEPAPTARTAQETALLEMHGIARQAYIDTLNSERGRDARLYLKSRGIRPKTAAEFGVGLSDGSGHQLVDKLSHYGRELMRASGLFVELPDGTLYDRFRDRLMFPIENERGETIAFGGRKGPEDKQAPKYINSAATEIYDKGATLYGLPQSVGSMAHHNAAVVVEGYLDVLAAHQAGQHNVVAPCGTALTPEHVAQLKERVDGAVLNFDPDAAGRKATDKAVQTALTGGLMPRVMLLDEDPADWLQEHPATEYKDAVKGAATLVEYYAQRARELAASNETYPGAEFEAKREAERWFQRALNSVPAAHREQISGALRQHLGLPAEDSAEQEKTLEHRAGWDVTFSAGKSISLTALVGGDARLIEAHDEAVREALAYGERAVQVKMGGLNAPQTTGRMVAALYRHDTSRPVEGYSAPQLHTHSIVFNMSQDAERQFRALNPTELFHLQSAMEAVYQTRLGFRAKQLGYETVHSAYHATEIKGYTQEYLDAESQRTEQIEAEKARLGQYGPAADSIVAKTTRAEKLNKRPEEIRASHLAHAEQYGNQPAQVVAAAREQHNRMLTPEERAQAADKAVEYARLRLSERTAVMEWYEIDRDALRLAQGNYTVKDVAAAVQRAQGRGEFREVGHWRPHAPEARYTTPELQAKEQKILSWMVDGMGHPGAIAGEITKDEFREKFRATLNDGQKHLVWNLIHSEDRMVGVQGWAGTGKTTALGVLKTFAEDYGFEVRGVAATGGAANELTKAGIASNTLAGFMCAQAVPKRPGLYLLDEASLADVHQMAAFLDRLRAEDRVVVIGDVKQHGSVGAGQVFRELQDAGMKTFHLRTIVRQQVDWYKDVVKEFARGEIKPALQALEDHARIHEFVNEKDRHAVMAKYFVLEPRQTLGVAPDNRARLQITDQIRQERTAHGQLGESRFQSRVLTPRSDMQKEDMRYAINYNPGDVIVYARGSRDLGLKAGDRAAVMQIDVDKNELTVMRESDGKMFNYNPSRVATTASAYEPTYREFAKGDRIQFTRNLGGIKNRQLGTITKLTEGGYARIELDAAPDAKPRIWAGNLDKFPYLDHGYVMTSFSAQGASAHRVLIHMDTDAPQTSRMLTQQLAYVAASRGRQDIHIFTNDIEELMESLQRIEQAPMALSPEERESYRAAVEAVKEAAKQQKGIGV